MNGRLTDKKIKEIFGGDVFVGDVYAGEPMKNHTTLRMGGPADLYIMPGNLLSLQSILAVLMEEDIAAMPLGGGSNLLVSDEGMEGAVVSTASLNHIEIIEESSGEVRLFVEAGAILGSVLNFAKARGYSGIEALAGIPGCVGGAIRGNAGSFGVAIGDAVESLTVIGERGSISMIERSALCFSYRSSSISEGTVIISANIRLRKDDPAGIEKRADDFLREKRRRQPISQSSAGCVFKNPPGAHAGRLIDEAGCKGMIRGDVEVSSLHANFFVNRGGGSAADFLGLMEDVKDRVLKSFGVELEPEIRIVGKGVNVCR
jgi:UDP-N-acetylmuramate dehydrogenase